jgi:hypothetical protein
MVSKPMSIHMTGLGVRYVDQANRSHDR